MRTKGNVKTNLSGVAFSEPISFRALNELVTRSRLAQSLGQSFGGARDLYSVCGYSKELRFTDYYNIVRRGRLGKRVLFAPVQSTWRGGCQVFENQEPDATQFEAAWAELSSRLKLVNKFIRLDKLVGLGTYGVLLMGFSDGATLATPIAPGKKLQLLYVQAYSSDNAKIAEWEQNPVNPRFGMPLYYNITTTLPGAGTPSVTHRVHYTRVIHVTEELLENDVEGSPRLESCYNTLQDLEKIAAGSAEMFWQGAFAGKAFAAKEGATLDVTSMDSMQKEIDEYVHGLRRYLRLQNMDVQDLAPQAVDPTNAINAQLDLLAGDTGIPKRILVGSERGELASSQDESNWLSRIKERREHYAEPCIVRPFVDYLLALGVLPPPVTAGVYQVGWQDLFSVSKKEQADISKTLTEALTAYSNATGADQIVPPEFYLEEVLGLSTEQIERITQILGERVEEPLPTVDEELAQ